MSTSSPRSPFLNVREAAAHLRVCDKTVYRMIGRGEMPAVRIGGSIRIDKRELQQYVYESCGSRGGEAA